MKRIRGLFIIMIILGVFTTILINESGRDTPYKRRVHEEYIKPFVDAKLNSVIISTRRTDLDLENFLGRRSQQFCCRDYATNVVDCFDTGLSEPILIGDTIRKRAGENRFRLSRKGYYYESYPIDSNKP